MSIPYVLPLGAFAGLTIFLGLPVARMRGVPQSVRSFLNAIATGILVFLLYDVLAKASDPITADLAFLKEHATTAALGTFALDAGALVLGLGVGLLSLVYYERFMIKGKAKAAPTTPATLGLMIAAGIGLHNFSEGLAIGQSALNPGLGLFWVLIIGFALHNITEGFGIAAPMASAPISWRFILLLGLIAGGPTFLGTAIGVSFYSQPVFVLFLGLAAGAIFYVISELLNVGRRFSTQNVVMWGIFVGFLAGYATDLIVTWGGA